MYGGMPVEKVAIEDLGAVLIVTTEDESV